MLIAISLSHLEAILIPKLQTLSFFSTLNAANFPPSLDTGGSSQSPELETIPPTTKGVPQSLPIPGGRRCDDDLLFYKQQSQASWSSTWSRFACCSGFRSKARNKIPKLLNLDSDEVCDLRLEIETSNQ